MSCEIKDELPLSKLKVELMTKSSNCCCICQTPFIHAHHIDFNNENNVIDNLVPLCPNHHALAHSKAHMFLNLTPERIRAIRDKWYEYVERRKESLGRNFGSARLKVKNFVSNRPLGEYATHSWAKTFSSLDPKYKEMTVREIIDSVFSATNPEDLKTCLETVKTMYSAALRKPEVKQEFREICNAFGFDFDGNNVI